MDICIDIAFLNLSGSEFYVPLGAEARLFCSRDDAFMGSSVSVLESSLYIKLEKNLVCPIPVCSNLQSFSTHVLEGILNSFSD